MARHEIARHKVVETWFDITTPKPAIDAAETVAEAQCLAEAEREEACREETDMDRHTGTSGAETPTAAMTEAAVETVWRTNRRGQTRFNLFNLPERRRPHSADT